MDATSSSASQVGAHLDVPNVRADANSAAGPIAVIELDRFCTSCAYNLRTMPVMRDPRTQIPVVRCPECGSFQPANHATTAVRTWLQRLISLALAAWMLLLTAAFVWLVVAEVAMAYATLDGLTTRVHTPPPGIAAAATQVVYVTRTYVVRDDVPHWVWMLAAMLAVSAALAFIMGTMITVVFPHWRRGVCRAVALAVPILVASIATLAWYDDAPQLLRWSLGYTGTHAVAQMFGGLLGVTIGRAVVRGVVRAFFPPGVRTHFSYLWLVDGKSLPAM